MIQEDSLDISIHLHPPFSFQLSEDGANKQLDTYLPNIINDSLAPHWQTFFVKESPKPLPRFFVERGTTHLNEIKRPVDSNVPLWIHLSFLFWIVVILFTRQSYTYRLNQIFVSTFSQQHVKQFQREGNILKQGFPVLLMFLYAFTISLFAYRAINLLYPNSFYFYLGEGFLLLAGVVVLFHFAKFIIIWLIGFMFETGQISFRYLLEHYIFHISEGIILFPILILYVYSGVHLFIYIAAIVLLALWIYRLLRAVIVGLECTNFSRYYLLLYLCTLEVLPVFILYKLAVQFV